MQKLFTIFISETDSRDRQICEHLSEYLEDGWKVIQITPLIIAPGEMATIRTWIAVLLEK